MFTATVDVIFGRLRMFTVKVDVIFERLWMFTATIKIWASFRTEYEVEDSERTFNKNSTERPVYINYIFCTILVCALCFKIKAQHKCSFYHYLLIIIHFTHK